jgi:hypothetical protein
MSWQDRGWGEATMIEQTRGLTGFGLNNAIRLRWVLRDINGRRLKWSPPDPNDLHFLEKMGFVEFRDGVPTLTIKGLNEIERRG